MIRKYVFTLAVCVAAATPALAQVEERGRPLLRDVPIQDRAPGAQAEAGERGMERGDRGEAPRRDARRERGEFRRGDGARPEVRERVRDRMMGERRMQRGERPGMRGEVGPRDRFGAQRQGPMQRPRGEFHGRRGGMERHGMERHGMERPGMKGPHHHGEAGRRFGGEDGAACPRCGGKGGEARRGKQGHQGQRGQGFAGGRGEFRRGGPAMQQREGGRRPMRPMMRVD